MELARGSIADRPWGMTLAALARRDCTGTLTVSAPEGSLWIAFDRGAIVGAGPVTSDVVLRAAMAAKLVSPVDFAQLSRRIAVAAEVDPVEALVAIARLSPDDTRRLRRRVIAEAAARTFGDARGGFVITSEVRAQTDLPVEASAVIALGARLLDPRRIAAELAPYGTRFAVRPEAIGQVPAFGFSDEELDVVHTLRRGATLAELVAAHPELGPGPVHAVAYALVTCLVCGTVAAPGPIPPVRHEPPARVARGTVGQPAAGLAAGSGLRVGDGSSAESANAAYRRGLEALDRDDLTTAIAALSRAIDLAPQEVDYAAALAWARFRAAPDKTGVADETRRALVRAIGRSRSPEIAHFYLGRVERILGRDRAALQHFHEVLQAAPDHAEAATEVRHLEARVSAPRRR